MNVLIDTNIILDATLVRKPFARQAQQIWQLCKKGSLVGYLTAASLTDIFYLIGQKKGQQVARRELEICVTTFNICTVSTVEVLAALALPGNDFEDNLQLACALANNLDAIVTRDKGFGKAGGGIAILSPAQLLQRIRR